MWGVGDGWGGQRPFGTVLVGPSVRKPYNYHQYHHRHHHHLLSDLHVQPRQEDRRDQPVHLPSPLRHLQPRLLALLLACQGDDDDDDDHDHQDYEPHDGHEGGNDDDDDYEDDYHEDGNDDDYDYEDNAPDGVDVEDLFTQGSNETYKNEAD